MAIILGIWSHKNGGIIFKSAVLGMKKVFILAQTKTKV